MGNAFSMISSVKASRLALGAAALAALVSLAACETKVEPPPPPPPVIAPPPPPPITLAPRLIEQASAFRGYMGRATAISPLFMDGAQIQQSLRIGAAYEPKQFMQGATAYAAVIALQDEAFVAGVRDFAKTPADRKQVAAQLIVNPAYVASISGSERAAGLIVSTLGGASSRLYATGRAVKQSAYDVQHSDWSKKHVEDQPGRLAAAKALSATMIAGDIRDVNLLQQASLGGARIAVEGRTLPPPYTPLVVRGMAIAALAVLGEAGEENMGQMAPLLTDANGAMCLNMGKLNLYQCLAVSKPHYEDVFCLGQHILMDTGQCLIKGSGAPTPLEIRPPALPLPGSKAVAAKKGKGSAKPTKKKS